MKKVESRVDWIYAKVATMVANFEFKPDERINEGTLAKKLGSSRTPLREALNRLVAEEFLTFHAHQGFFCRTLDPKTVFDLYNARLAIETESIRLAIHKATDAEILKIESFLDDTQSSYSKTSSFETLVELDEEFHMQLLRLSDNDELERILGNLNAKIRYVRRIEIGDQPTITEAAHRRILAAIKIRDETKAVFELRGHISRRREDANSAVQRAFSKLYVPSSSSFMERSE
ncbi:MAG: GntR family transcriptional regulator [Rhodobacteraceae bacterium]|nr:GntR family transcriptional regulator [Paracoccaceae bacterium]